MTARRAALALALAIMALGPSLAPTLPASAPPDSAGRAEPAPPWAVGCRWKWVADQDLDFCTTVGAATIRITRVFGDMQDTVADRSTINGTEAYRVDGKYSETLTGTLTVLGFPTPIMWPVTGNATFYYRVPDLALIYSYQHIVIEMGSVIGTFTADTSTSASPPVEYYRFPLDTGNSWKVRSDLWVWTKTSGAGGAFESTSEDRLELDATIPRTQDAVVPAGTLTCYNLTFNGTYTSGGGPPEPQNGSALYSPKATNLVFRDFSPMAGLSVVFSLSEYSLNHAPAVASPVPEARFPEDTTGSLDLYSVFSDQDAADRLGFSAGNFTNIATSVDNATGTATFSPPANWSGSESVIFTAMDGKGARATAAVNVTVTPVNDAPVLVRPLPGIIMDEDTVNDTLDLTQYFDDADFPYGDSLSFSKRDNGSVGVNISPKGIVTLRPFENWSGVHDLTVIATDRAGAAQGGLLKVAVLNTPDAPVSVATAHGFTTWEDASLELELLARFYDADEPYGDRLTFSIEDVTTGFEVRLDGPAGLLNITPPADWNGATTLYLVATDTTGLNATEMVRLEVVPVNDPPLLVAAFPAGATATMAENSTLAFSVLADDIDSPGLNVSWQVDGRTVAAGQNFTFFAGFDSERARNVTVLVDDGQSTVARTWAVAVTDVNRPPWNVVILSPANGTKFAYGAKVNLTGTATDPDNDPLTFTWKDTNGKLLGTGAAVETKSLSKGKHVVTLEVSDGNATASATVTLSVSPPPETRTPGFGGTGVLLGAALAAVLATIAGPRRLSVRSTRRGQKSRHNRKC